MGMGWWQGGQDLSECVLQGPVQKVNLVLVDGEALTPNVDADFFNKWLAQNKDSDVVRNALVFAFEKLDGAVSEAMSNAMLKSGQVEEADLREENDVAAQHPDIVNQMEQILRDARVPPALDAFKLKALGD